MKKLSFLMIPIFAVAAPSPNNNQQMLKRDPFAASPKMHAASGRKGQQGNPYGQFTPAYGPQQVPTMRLKGFVTKKGRNKATALLEIKGAGVYMVSKGDRVGLHSIGLNTILEIVDINSNGVKVRTGQINQVIIVR